MNDPYTVAQKNLGIAAMNPLAASAGLPTGAASPVGGPAQPGYVPGQPSSASYGQFVLDNPRLEAEFRRLTDNPKVQGRYGTKTDVPISFDANADGTIQREEFGRWLAEKDPADYWNRSALTPQANPMAAAAAPGGPGAPAAPARPTIEESARNQFSELLIDPSYLADTPGYQFGLEQGNRNINAALGLRGLTDSGARAKELQTFGQDYAFGRLDDERAFLSDTLGQERSFLSSLATGGQYAADRQAAAGSTYAGRTGNILQNAGDARAAGTYAAAEPIAGAFGELGEVAGGAISDWAKRRKNPLAMVSSGAVKKPRMG